MRATNGSMVVSFAPKPEPKTTWRCRLLGHAWQVLWFGFNPGEGVLYVGERCRRCPTTRSTPEVS